MRKHEVTQAYSVGLINNVTVLKGVSKKWIVNFDVSEFLCGEDIQEDLMGNKFCLFETARFKLRQFSTLDSVAKSLSECGIYKFNVKFDNSEGGVS